MRAALVNSVVLAEKAMALELGPLLRLGKGEERSAGRTKESILAGAFEALLGGVYQDGGYEAARGIVERYFAADIERRTSASRITRPEFKKSASAVSCAAQLSSDF